MPSKPTDPPPDVRVTVDLPPREAMALAQMLKRQGWSDWRSVSIDNDEAYVMRDACDKLRNALAGVGFSPR